MKLVKLHPPLLAALSALVCSLATCQALAAPVPISHTGTIQAFTVQTTGEYAISACGAQGAGSY